jgi:hypothetical protein
MNYTNIINITNITLVNESAPIARNNNNSFLDKDNIPFTSTGLMGSGLTIGGFPITSVVQMSSN